MNKKFEEQLNSAVYKYGDEHVDIIVEDGKVYGTYHSKNNSFSVTDIYKLQELGGIEALQKYEDEFVELCTCEI